VLLWILKGISNWLSFDLSFRCQAINDRELELLAKCLEENPRITDIAFDFSRCGEITNKGLTNFSKCLNPSALRSVKLVFSEAFRVTNEGIMSFSHEIRRFLNLKCLHLDFSWCWQINSKGLESIIETKNLVFLEDFSLNLSRHWLRIFDLCWVILVVEDFQMNPLPNLENLYKLCLLCKDLISPLKRMMFWLIKDLFV